MMSLIFRLRPSILWITLSCLGFLSPNLSASDESLPSSPTEASETTMESRCKKEVLDLHQFFEDWFLARLPDTDDAFARFGDVMDPKFRIVGPTGRLTALKPLSAGLRSAHGSWKGTQEPTRIWIENITVQLLDDTRALVTYEEWQEIGGPAKGRLSSGLFELDPKAPNGVRWRHLHETWMPKEDTPGS